jgi:hypothetical protein
MPARPFRAVGIFPHGKVHADFKLRNCPIKPMLSCYKSISLASSPCRATPDPHRGVWYFWYLHTPLATPPSFSSWIYKIVSFPVYERKGSRLPKQTRLFVHLGLGDQLGLRMDDDDDGCSSRLPRSRSLGDISPGHNDSRRQLKQKPSCEESREAARPLDEILKFIRTNRAGSMTLPR